MIGIFREIHMPYDALGRTRQLVNERIGDIRPGRVGPAGVRGQRLRLGNPALAIPAGGLVLRLDTYRPALGGCVSAAPSRSGEASEVVRSRPLRRAG